MVESSSLEDCVCVAAAVVAGLAGRNEDSNDDLLFDVDVVSGLDLSLSSVLNGLSTLMRLVGRLGVHRENVLGCLSIGLAISGSVSAIAKQSA